MPVGEVLMDSHHCGVAVAPSRMAAGSCTSSITVTGTRQTQLRPANKIQFKTRDPKWILKRALPKGEERSKVTFLTWARAHTCKQLLEGLRQGLGWKECADVAWADFCQT